jgi:hypothetical protein
MVRLCVVEARGHVIPVLGESGFELLVAGQREERRLGNERQRIPEPVDREDLGHVGTLRHGVEGERAVLG